MCEYNTFILSIVQSYVLYWHHTYLLHPDMDRTETMICQHFYWPYIRDAVQKELTNFDTCQRTKKTIKKYGRLPSKESREIT